MRPDGRYRAVVETQPRIESDPSALSDAAAIQAMRGMKKSSALMIAIVTSAASVLGTWLSTSHAAPAECASKADLGALDKHVSELASTVEKLSISIGRNADQAHNDTRDVAVELHSYINSHAK